jgi:hypothetical protein
VPICQQAGEEMTPWAAAACWDDERTVARNHTVLLNEVFENYYEKASATSPLKRWNPKEYNRVEAAPEKGEDVILNVDKSIRMNCLCWTRFCSIIDDKLRDEAQRARCYTQRRRDLSEGDNASSKTKTIANDPESYKRQRYDQNLLLWNLDEGEVTILQFFEEGRWTQQRKTKSSA